ncbi:MAG: hypothetical protein ABSH06_18495 [Thermodesulfobacteriota bacterium]|jgi:hypothetical protein
MVKGGKKQSFLLSSLELRKKKNLLSRMVNFIQADLDKLSLREERELRMWLLPRYGGKRLQQRLGTRPTDQIITLKGIQKLQKALKAFSNRVLNLREDGKPIVLPLRKRQLIITPSGQYSVYYPIFSNSPTPDTSLIITEFANLLNGLPKDAMRTCPQCQKVFVHLSLKPKIYCSNRCAYKAIYRKRIERLQSNGEYELYLETQRKVMKKRYREKILGKEG